MSRFAQAVSDVPLANLCAIALCCLAYVFQVLDNPPLLHYTLCPRNVIYLNEYYRFVSSTFFHGGLMHIAMNVTSTAAIGTMLERRFGTLRHGITILWGVLLTSTVYCLAALTSSVLLGSDGLMYQHSVGFSGVLFQLSVLEANLSPNSTRSVFGFVSVPSWAYPWALLVFLQVFMPHISFWGHLAGILVGTLQLYGALDFIFPSDAYLREMELWPRLRGVLTGKPNFVPTPSEESLAAIGAAGERRSPRLLGAAMLRLCAGAWKLVRDVAETVKVCIFGYDHRGTADGASDDDDLEEGEDWDVEVQPLRQQSEVETRTL